MEITEKLIKPLKEANYLNVDNTDRYRPIIRLFFEHYEKLKYWMYQEEVYEELAEDPYFSGYTLEQCQQDLAALVSWGNLITIQDTRKVTTIDEFKNKKFRYQLSEYAVEIERMVIHLENLFIEGASLEPTLLERICIHFSRLKTIGKETEEQIYGFWDHLNTDFIRLNQNYQDYMHTLNSVKAEEMMRTKEFLLFKDHLVEYLRNFVKSLQLNASMIEQYIRSISEEELFPVLNKVVQYELSIPRMDVEINEEMIREKIFGRWESMRAWFVGENGKESESSKVFDTTNEIIRKMTRYAARISELSNQGANRREEYHKLAQIFLKCENLSEAHRLSACVFGIEKPFHIKADLKRKTESIHSGVFEEEPYVQIVKPRTRTYREKERRTGITDRTAQKEEARRIVIENARRERELLEGYIKDNRLDFSRLPVLEPKIRDIFLTWLSKALEHKNRTAKTEDGREYRIEEEAGKTCVLSCTDGEFTMPGYTLVFTEHSQ